MRDQAIRVKAGIGLRHAARELSISDNTLRIYEIDPMAVRDAEKRRKIAAYYERLRAFVGEPSTPVAAYA